MGIYLYSATGADSFAATGSPDPNQSGSFGGGNNADVFTYTVNVSGGESVVIGGNFGDNVNATGGSSFSLIGGAPSFGTLVVNGDGTFTYSFDRAAVDANGGNQTVSFQVTGTDNISSADTDTVNVVITCFGRGTLITTPMGDCAVEALQIGDLVRTADGRDVPVSWVGRQTVKTLFRKDRMAPVRIAAGALGDGLPLAELTVTADHGMIVDGLVINASALVNGRSINWVPDAELPNAFMVYHVETAAHDVILANGAPAETFMDCAGRQAFDNYAEYVALYGAERIIPEMSRIRISAQRLVPEAIKVRLGIVEDHEGFEALISA